MLNNIRNEIVAEGSRYFTMAKTELEFHGKTTEFQRLIGIAEGLRMALSIIFGTYGGNANGV